MTDLLVYDGCYVVFVHYIIIFIVEGWLFYFESRPSALGDDPWSRTPADVVTLEITFEVVTFIVQEKRSWSC